MNGVSIREPRGHGLPGPFIVTVVLAAAAILWFAPRAAHGEYRNLLTAFIILQGLWIVLFWRMGVYLLMAYVVVEGFMLNYFYLDPSLNLVKDVLVGLLYLSLAVMLVVRRRAPFPRLGWVLPFAGFALVYAAEIFNPNLPSIMVGLVGLRVTLFYSLLATVGYWFFDSTQRVVRFFVFMVALSIPVAVFGIVQYVKGPMWMISISPGFERAVYYTPWTGGTGMEGHFRTFSSFVQTGSFSTYLEFSMLITAAVWGVFRARWQRALIAAVLLLQFFAMLTTGGRTPFVLLFGAVVLWVFLQRGSLRLAPLVLLLPLFFYGVTRIAGPAFQERYSTILDAEEVRTRNIPLITGWFQEAMNADWAGLGAGYACVASRHVGETPLNVFPVENGLAKMRFEAGVPGLLLYVVFLISFILTSSRQALRVPDPGMRWFAAPVAAFIVLNLMFVPIGSPFDISPLNVYLWFFAGFLGRAPLLRSEPEIPLGQVLRA